MIKLDVRTDCLFPNKTTTILLLLLAIAPGHVQKYQRICTNSSTQTVLLLEFKAPAAGKCNANLYRYKNFKILLLLLESGVFTSVTCADP